MTTLPPLSNEEKDIMPDETVVNPATEEKNTDPQTVEGQESVTDAPPVLEDENGVTELDNRR